MVEKEPNRPVGIDLGLHTFRRAERPRPSGGPQSHKENPVQDQQIEEGLSLTSQEGDGSRQGVAHRKGNEPIRSDFRLAHQLLNTYDRIAVEDLNVSGMLRSKRFSKKMSEQRWETLCQILEHKAWKAGVRYVRVNPSHTSTDCSSCGHRQSMPLSVRVYECGGCGLINVQRPQRRSEHMRARLSHREPRDRPGRSADVPRNTNLCCKTAPLFGARRQADDTEQYQSALGQSGK